MGQQPCRCAPGPVVGVYTAGEAEQDLWGRTLVTQEPGRTGRVGWCCHIRSADFATRRRPCIFLFDVRTLVLVRRAEGAGLAWFTGGCRTARRRPGSARRSGWWLGRTVASTGRGRRWRQRWRLPAPPRRSRPSAIGLAGWPDRRGSPPRRPAGSPRRPVRWLLDRVGAAVRGPPWRRPRAGPAGHWLGERPRPAVRRRSGPRLAATGVATPKGSRPQATSRRRSRRAARTGPSPSGPGCTASRTAR